MPHSQTADLVITRIFSAPRELVFNVWSDPKHLARWWGPKGFDIAVKKMEFRKGGMFHYSFTSPGGHLTWGRFVFRLIIPPERIEFVNSFSDENGGITRAPFEGMWPLEMLTIVTLIAESASSTKLTLLSYAINANDDERKTFEAGIGSMQQGFGGTFDQLDSYLKTLS